MYLKECRSSMLRFAIVLHVLEYNNSFIAIPCNENDLRLTEGTNDREGILEVCKNGVWTRVCTDDYTTNVHSEQLCSYFGYSSQG